MEAYPNPTKGYDQVSSNSNDDDNRSLFIYNRVEEKMFKTVVISSLVASGMNNNLNRNVLIHDGIIYDIV